jgi:hypothetical protein
MTNVEGMTKHEEFFVICASELHLSFVIAHSHVIHVIPSEVEGSRRATFEVTSSGSFDFAMRRSG